MKFFLCLFVLFYASGCSTFNSLAERSLYPFEKVNESIPYEKPDNVEALETDDFFLWSIYGEGPIIFYFHGNGESLSALSMIGLTDVLGQLGHTILMEYPGIHPAPGEPTEKEITYKAVKMIEEVKAALPDREIVIMGRSLGAAVAMAAASHTGPDKLILISPWTDFESVAKKSPLGWATFLVTNDFWNANEWNSLEKASLSEYNALVIHGADDKLIPYEMGEEMARELRAVMFKVPGRGHNDVLHDPEAWGAIIKFMANIL